MLFVNLHRNRRKTMGRAVLSVQSVVQVAGTKKPGDSQKAKAFWTMKAARDRVDDFYDPARKSDILGRPQTRLQVWEEHLTSSLRRSLFVLAKAVEFRPCVTAETLKARALIGLHFDGRGKCLCVKWWPVSGFGRHTSMAARIALTGTATSFRGLRARARPPSHSMSTTLKALL